MTICSCYIHAQPGQTNVTQSATCSDSITMPLTLHHELSSTLGRVLHIIHCAHSGFCFSRNAFIPAIMSARDDFHTTKMEEGTDLLVLASKISRGRFFSRNLYPHAVPHPDFCFTTSFAALIATLECPAITAAESNAPSTHSSGDSNTLATTPQRSASAAENSLPVKMSSMALALPTALVNRCRAASPGDYPELDFGLTEASAGAGVDDIGHQGQVRSPPPSATPLTAAMSGFERRVGSAHGARKSPL